MKVAVVGSGSAGVTCAWLLQQDHEVALFEHADRPGGHAHTVSVEVDGRRIHVELGAEFFFEEGYGGLRALIDRMGLTTTREELAVSLTCEGRSTFAMPPKSPAALWSCLAPAVARDLFWLRNLAKAAEVVADTGDWSVTVQQLVERTGMPRDVADRVAIPLIASSWGVPCEVAAEMAAYSVVRVMGLRLSHKPHSFRLEEGLSSHINRLVADSPRCDLRLATPVQKVDRDEQGLVIVSRRGSERFDAVILACDWRNSAALCAGSSALAGWRRAFEAFEDNTVRVALHRDPSLMPANRKLWETANYWLTRSERPRTTIWSGKRAGVDVFRTWMREGEAAPAGTSHVVEYRHIVITPSHPARQAALARLQGSHGLWAAGMYTDGIDNHESAVRSALLVARRVLPEGERVRWLGPRVSS